MYHLGIDLGGTNIAAAVVTKDYEIVGRSKVKTRAQRPVEDIADDMAAAAKQAIQNAGLRRQEVEVMGCGCPGSVDPTTGMIARSNNLNMKHVPMRQMIEERMDCKFYIENDANAAAYGEMIAGAGRGAKNFVAITLGTGVGGGVVIDGKIMTGFNYAGAELGHMVIQMNGAVCSCGRRGCFEAYASATALIRITRDAMRKNKQSLMWSMVEGDIRRVSGRTAFDAMRRGDVTGSGVVEQYCKYVACGTVNLVNIFQPEIFCIGGGISAEKDYLLAPVRKIVEAERFSQGVEKQTAIKIAELGNDAGLIGAAFLNRLYE